MLEGAPFTKFTSIVISKIDKFYDVLGQRLEWFKNIFCSEPSKRCSYWYFFKIEICYYFHLFEPFSILTSVLLPIIYSNFTNYIFTNLFCMHKSALVCKFTMSKLVIPTYLLTAISEKFSYAFIYFLWCFLFKRKMTSSLFHMYLNIP